MKKMLKKKQNYKRKYSILKKLKQRNIYTFSYTECIKKIGTLQYLKQVEF